MDVLSQFVVPVTMATCVAIGYIIKHSLDFIPNKYIPLIMAVIGLAINIWVNQTITPEIFLGGLASGLAATGAFEAVRNIVDTDDKTTDDNTDN